MYKKLLGWLPAHSGLRIWRALFFASGVFITASRSELLSPWTSVNGALKEPVPETLAKGGESTNKAPWGQLEATKMTLQNYDDLFPAGTGKLREPEWVFENTTREQLMALFGSASLSDKEKAFFMDTNRWVASSNGFLVRPPDEMIAGLKKETRQVLYPVLAKSMVNYPQYLCYRFPIGGFESVFANSSFPADKVALLAGMAYTNEGTLCLAVDRSIQKKLTGAEFDDLLRTVFSVKTWRVSIRVSPDSDIDALANYWGKGGRERAIRPLLESMARQPNGGLLNVSYFLPPFARMRLYTYPYAYPGLDVMDEDCFFTARFFFRQDTTNPRTEEAPDSVTRLLASCEGTNDRLQFGDVLLLVDANDKPIHACVYLAADFVYTKNGIGFAKPWVIMKMDEMMTDYRRWEPLRVLHMRPKQT